MKKKLKTTHAGNKTQNRGSQCSSILDLAAELESTRSADPVQSMKKPPGNTTMNDKSSANLTIAAFDKGRSEMHQPTSPALHEEILDLAASPNGSKQRPDLSRVQASKTETRSKELDKLSKALDGLKPNLSGASREQEADQRAKVVAAVTAFARNRSDLGEQLTKYKPFFKEERTWSQVCVQIGRVLNCNEKTVRRIVEDFERASVVSGFERAAAKNCRIQLEARKHRPILDELVKMLQTKGRAKGMKEAQERVAEAMKLAGEAKDRKQVPKTTTGLSGPKQQVFDYYHGLRAASKGRKPQEIVPTLTEALRYFFHANNYTQKIEITPTVAPPWVVTGRDIPTKEKAS